MKKSNMSIFWPTTLYGQCWLLWFLLASEVVRFSVRSEVLTPPYFNLAGNRRITASATCGDEGQELYCKLVGANSETDGLVNNIIHGQVRTIYLWKPRFGLISSQNDDAHVRNNVNCPCRFATIVTRIMWP